MIKESDVFKIGFLKRTHGVNGELEMSFTDDVFDKTNADYLFIMTEGLFVPFFIEEYRWKNDETVFMKFEDIDNLEKAESFLKCSVYFPLSLVPEENETPLRLNALTGYRLYGVEEGIIGEILYIDTSSANTLLTVKDKDGKEILIPLHNDLIKDYCEKERKITMEIPEGLLNLDE